MLIQSKHRIPRPMVHWVSPSPSSFTSHTAMQHHIQHRTRSCNAGTISESRPILQSRFKCSIASHPPFPLPMKQQITSSHLHYRQHRLASRHPQHMQQAVSSCNPATRAASLPMLQPRLQSSIFAHPAIPQPRHINK